MTSPQAGWYPDPSGDPTKLRYWNGAQWTDQYAAAQAASQSVYQTPPTVQAQSTIYPMSESDRTLRLVAFILALLITIGVCWLIIPLAWTIPMTVHTWNIYKGTKPNTTAFGVCTLLFVGIIPGILLLCSHKDTPPY